MLALQWDFLSVGQCEDHQHKDFVTSGAKDVVKVKLFCLKGQFPQKIYMYTDLGAFFNNLHMKTSSLKNY
jgi:hypothetical protein